MSPPSAELDRVQIDAPLGWVESFAKPIASRDDGFPPAKATRRRGSTHATTGARSCAARKRRGDALERLALGIDTEFLFRAGGSEHQHGGDETAGPPRP